MPTTLAITNIGSKYKVVINSSTQPIYTSSPMKLSYNTVNNTVDVGFVTEDNSPCYYTGIAIANLTIGGVVITNQTVFETQVASVFLNAGSAAIPTRADSLVLLTGEIILSSGNYYFVDRSGNARNFLITGYDFDANWTRGFPYKSAATISAPAGDATLIAADLNSFLYTAGTPNQIPVVSLFQDIDYKHKMFSLHQAAQLDSNGIEILEARVINFVIYNTVKAGADLLNCVNYFNVPTENTTTSVWLSPSGNDTTGTGTKLLPYRSLNKIRTTTSTVVYMVSGNYDIGTTSITWTGSAVMVQGLGLVSFSLATTGPTGMLVQRPLSIYNCSISDSVTTGINHTQSVSYTRCKITKTAGSYFNLCNSAGKDLTIRNCVISSGFVGISLIANLTPYGIVTLDGNFGIIKVSIGATNISSSLVLKYNKGISGSTFSSYFLALTYKGNTSLGVLSVNGTTSVTNINNETINFPISIAGANVNIDSCLITGNVTAPLLSFSNSVINGVISSTGVTGMRIFNNTINAPINTTAVTVTAIAGANITGIVFEKNNVTGNKNTTYLVYIGGASESSANAINGTSVRYNKITNTNTSASGSCHTLFIGGGIDPEIKYNRIYANTGYGIVIKGGGGSCVKTNPHIAYNVISLSNSNSYTILDRGLFGLIIANNTVITTGLLSSNFGTDDDAQGFANSILCINNVIYLGANITGAHIFGTNATGRDNLINLNGFTVGSYLPTDRFITVPIDANGVPSSRLNDGEILTGTGNDIGLDQSYSIPSAIVFKQQNGLWQQGAIIL